MLFFLLFITSEASGTGKDLHAPCYRALAVAGPPPVVVMFVARVSHSRSKGKGKLPSAVHGLGAHYFLCRTCAQSPAVWAPLPKRSRGGRTIERKKT